MLHQPNHTLVCNKSFQKKNTLATRSIHSALQKQHVIRKKVNNFLLVEIVLSFWRLKKSATQKMKFWGTCNNIKERNSTKMLVIHPMASFFRQKKNDRSKLLKRVPLHFATSASRSFNCSFFPDTSTAETLTENLAPVFSFCSSMRRNNQAMAQGMIPRDWADTSFPIMVYDLPV